MLTFVPLKISTDPFFFFYQFPLKLMIDNKNSVVVDIKFVCPLKLCIGPSLPSECLKTPPVFNAGFPLNMC